MAENYTAMEKGCMLFRGVFAKPVYLLIISYLARTYWHSHPRHSRTHEKIEEDVCKNPGVDKEQISWSVLEMLARDGWIKKICPGRAGAPIEYEITEQGNQFAVFLRNKEISRLFKP